MTLSVSFKHHWVHFLHGRSGARAAYQRACIFASTWIHKEARGRGGATASPELVSARQGLMASADGVVSCHILTAVPTWTLAWLGHPSLWRLWGPLAERALCPVCTQDLWPQWGMFTQLKSNSVALSPSCTDWRGSHLGHIYWPISDPISGLWD